MEHVSRSPKTRRSSRAASAGTNRLVLVRSCLNVARVPEWCGVQCAPCILLYEIGEVKNNVLVQFQVLEESSSEL